MLYKNPEPPARARLTESAKQRCSQHSPHKAGSNSVITLWEAPTADPDNPELPWRKRWGTHVLAFTLFPQQTLQQIMDFMAINEASEQP